MSTFETYAKFVDLCGPPSAGLAVAKISNALLDKICIAISIGEIKEASITNTDDRFDDHVLLTVDTHSNLNDDKLNSNLTVLDLHRLSGRDPLLRELHKEVRELFSADIGSPYVIVNSRMWKTHPNSEFFGPNDFHTDGFFPGHLKVMIYVSPLSQESGYFEFKDGPVTKKLINLPAGTSILFRNSDVVHRGVPGTVEPRISIELTLMRAIESHDQSWNGHFYGRHLVDPSLCHHFKVYDGSSGHIPHMFIAKIDAGMKVNIGSGRRDSADWLCLDELVHPGVKKIVFSPEVSLPLENNSVSLFYSSHCFEHLDDKTLNKLLKEMHRSAKKMQHLY